MTESCEVVRRGSDLFVCGGQEAGVGDHAMIGANGVVLGFDVLAVVQDFDGLGHAETVPL